MSIRDSVPYVNVEGPKKGSHIRVYALSTCGFCEKAMNWLKDQGYHYEYIFIDNLEIEVKRQLKAELKATYGDLSVFPVMIINQVHCISGFTEEKYLDAFSASKVAQGTT